MSKQLKDGWTTSLPGSLFSETEKRDPGNQVDGFDSFRKRNTERNLWTEIIHVS